METHSGVPALSVAQREHYETERRKIFEEIPELIGKSDLHRLPIPYISLPFHEWRKQDIRAVCHPAHLALIVGQTSRKQEEEHRYEIESAFEAGNITEEQRDEFINEVNARRDLRLKELHGLMKE